MPLSPAVSLSNCDQLLEIWLLEDTQNETEGAVEFRNQNLTTLSIQILLYDFKQIKTSHFSSFFFSIHFLKRRSD